MNYYIPCICPIINSLSSLSVPANRSSLPPRASRNFLLRPVNQFSQKGFVLARSVRHFQDVATCESVDGSSRRRPWTDTRAEAVLRIVRDRVLDQRKNLG